MQVLVTGGGGFLGRYICEQLVARGDRVRSFGRGAYPELTALDVETVRGNIANLSDVSDACQGAEVVFHVAARPGTYVQPQPYHETNTVGTQNVVDACRRHGVSRLIYTSSPSVVFAGVDQTNIDETTPLALEWLSTHRSFYSHSKALGEQIVLAASDEQLRTCALRPHLIWGPRDQHLIPRLIARAKSGRLRRVGGGKNLVDMIYVENAAAAHLLAADALAGEDSPVAGKAYFLSQGEPVNCWEWIDEILSLVGLPPVQKSISQTAAWRVGVVLETVYRVLGLSGEPPMTRFLAAQLATSHWFDISAARRDFGYEPSVSTAEGMRRLGEWMNENASEPRA
ncbi:MAG: NAD-dependent epimerase/dehydratase family protein [Planctomycetes bacterium]|nr:NAD-dependent epimerase/dehydratase family protein [Planctomycetota bacterium]